ncbi:P-loop containing nucleoside triphosphate hydrolase protein [Thelonectria olida]|uniref:P-loop containing nucleoside triphosphate hydrolase protein n=1 Tax=Thelonectria olida TaxID=1576542 RepID=A0A9P8W0H7_9HYPO|nr:P-loop containing nucleoside triphosphate hydrolase protein [Thelonectria olida]
MPARVMGPTGSGKSTFINNVLGQERFKVGVGMASETSMVEDELIEIDGQLIRLVDTPGFDDTTLTDTQVLEMIVTWMGVQYKQKRKFAGILYLRDITEYKMKGSDITNLRMFRALCGTSGLDNVIVVTTKWNTMTENRQLAEYREEQLLSDYLKPMLKSGAEYARDHGTAKSSRTIIRKVLKKNQAFFLDLQREIIDEGKRLNEIEAGKVLQEQLLKAEQKYKENLQALSQELKHEHSKEMREALEDERRKTAKALKEAKAAQGQLNEEYSKKFEEQEKQFRQLMENLRQDYEKKMETASADEKEKLRKKQAELEKALETADHGDNSPMWNMVSFISFMSVRPRFFAAIPSLLPASAG